MLKNRILTGVILAPMIVFAILESSYDGFALMFGAFILLAAWEWSDLSGIESRLKRGGFVLCVGLGAIALSQWAVFLDAIADLMETIELTEYAGVIDWLVILPVFWWIFISIILKHFPDRLLKLRPKRRTKTLVGWFILVMGWFYMTRLHYFGKDTLLFFIFLIWCADIAAYFSGKYWGKTKLSPQISPGKTVAGLYGALILTISYTVVVCFFQEYAVQRILDFVLLSLLTVMFSVSGDLFESLVKRWRGVKDSGQLLPGHGGVLDRLDSLIAAIPIFYLGVLLMSEQYL